MALWQFPNYSSCTYYLQHKIPRRRYRGGPILYTTEQINFALAAWCQTEYLTEATKMFEEENGFWLPRGHLGNWIILYRVKHVGNETKE